MQLVRVINVSIESVPKLCFAAALNSESGRSCFCARVSDQVFLVWLPLCKLWSDAGFGIYCPGFFSRLVSLHLGEQVSSNRELGFFSVKIFSYR